nr:discoidin domain-containing protein [uncultured Alloprevotella sp.]
MKHFYSRTAMLLAMFFACIVVSAQTVYSAVGFGEGNYLKTITPGQKVCLQAARASSTCVLDTALTENLKTAITDNGVWEFQVANEATNQYYLFNPASGKYLGLGTNEDGYAFFTMKASQRNAEAFYVRTSENYANAAAVPADADWGAVTFDSYPGALIFTFSDWGAPTKSVHYQMFAAPGKATGFTNQSQGNCWYAYAVEEVKGLDKLSAVFNQYFPSGTNDEFVAGSEPGNIPQDKFDALQEVFERAQKLINESSTNVEACNKACVDIEKAYKAAHASIIPFTEGYYFIVNNGGDAAGMFETNNEMHFNKASWTRPEHPTANDMAYIWKLVPANSTPNNFYLQNYLTGNYTGFINAFSTVIPTVTEKKQIYEIFNFPGQKGYFALQAQGSEMLIHANTSGANTVVFWDSSHKNSAWQLFRISQEDVDALQAALEQEQAKKHLTELYEQASGYYQKGLTYNSAATVGDYPTTVDGLVTKAAQLSTNAQEPSEGPIAGLVDGDLKTFFHTAWSVALPDVKYPCLTADLEKAVDAITLKYAKRYNANPGGLPLKVRVFASNDSINWVEQSLVSFSFTDSATIDGTKIANYIGRTSVAFKDGEKYRYVRLQVESNLGSARAKGNLYFYLGELRIYEAAYDKDHSLAENVDQAVRKNFVDQLTAAATAIASGTATQAGVDALKAAFEAYKAVYPDPAALKAEIAKLKTLANAAVEGDNFGEYTAGAKDTFQAALDAVANHVDDYKTMALLENAKSQLAEAAKAFDAALHKPATGDIVFFRANSTTASVNKQFVYAGSNSTQSTLRWGGYSAEDGEDANLNNRLNYMWLVTANADGSYSFKNIGTGLYMAGRTTKASSKENDLRLAAPGSETPINLLLEGAPKASSFQMNLGVGTYLRFYTRGDIVFSDNGSSADSYFTIEKATAWGESSFLGFTAQRPTPCTLPYEVEASIGDEGTLYKVAGLFKEGETTTLELTAYAATDRIPAGTPFIVVINENLYGANFFPTATSLKDFNYSYEGHSVNGLCGTLDRTPMKAGYGLFSKGKIIVATSEDVLGANSAYLDFTVPMLTAKAEYSVPVEGFTVTGITQTVVPQQNAAIYDLQGRRVLKAQKGLYIINGKKVVVK